MNYIISVSCFWFSFVVSLKLSLCAYEGKEIACKHCCSRATMKSSRHQIGAGVGKVLISLTFTLVEGTMFGSKSFPQGTFCRHGDGNSVRSDIFLSKNCCNVGYS